MAISDVLVHVDSSRAMPGRVRAAAALARRHDAHLVGLYVIEIPVLPAYAQAQIPATILEAQRAAFASSAASAEREFGNIAGKSGISSEWRCSADLKVMGAYGHARLREILLGGVTAHVLAHADIPTLLAH